MVVSVALFAIVMTICVDVLLSLVNANRKAQALQSVMNNLNITLDGMVRPMRQGNNFHCGAGLNTTVQDCPLGDTSFAFEPFGNKPTDPPWVYSFAQDSNGIGRIYKSENGQLAVPITAPEVSIDEVEFYVVGANNATAGNLYVQPKVIIVIKGSAGAPGTRARTTFHIQATAVQRVLDL
jgi:type II secretory pathway pseudopilin PulG